MARTKKNEQKNQEYQLRLLRLGYGSRYCICPSCSTKIVHEQRGKPCNTIPCPKCGTMMRGEHCI